MPFYTALGKEKDAPYVKDLHTQCKQWRDPYQDKWLSSYKYYRSFRKQSEYPLRSNIFVPYTWALVEHVVPKMLNVVFNTEPIVACTARHGGIAVNISPLLENVLDFEFQDDRADFYFNLKTFFKESAIYGTSFGRSIPRFKGDNAEDLSFDYIEFQPLDLFNVFPDWRGTRLNHMKWLILRHDMDWDELKLLQSQGFMRHVNNILEHPLLKSKQDEYKKKRMEEIEQDENYGLDEDRKVIQVLEYWDKNHILYVAGNYVIRAEENPYGSLYPFVMNHYTTIPHELYGIGIPEMVEDLQEELNTLRNQRLDNVNLVINRMFIANKLADIDFDSLISYPGNVIYTNDMDAIEPVATPDVTASSYKEEGVYKEDMQWASGIFGPSVGEPPPARTPATTTIRLQQATNVRFDGVIKDIEFGALRHIARNYVSLTWSFMNPREFAKVVGLENFVEKGGVAFYNTPPEEILRSYHFQVSGSATTAVKELHAQQIIQGYTFAKDDPWFNQYEIRKRLMEALDQKDIRKLLNERPMVPLEEAQAQIEQAQTEAYERGVKDGVKSQRGSPAGAQTKPANSSPPSQAAGRGPSASPGGISPEAMQFNMARGTLSPAQILAGAGGINTPLPAGTQSVRMGGGGGGALARR